jgi:hypothetical protein
MAETFHEIAALVPRGILRWIRLERGLVEEQRLPDGERGADVEGKPKSFSRVVSRTGATAAIR